jgi:bacterioferritin-associated ferredoxin
MIVCSCNVITDSKIKDSLQGEACPRTPLAVYRCLGCSPNCGRCFATVRMIISEALGQQKSEAATCNGACAKVTAG